MAVTDLLYGAYERRLANGLDPARLPRHVGAIVDGNRTELWMRRPWAGGWLATALPFPPFAGDFHSATIVDMDGDGSEFTEKRGARF